MFTRQHYRAIAQAMARHRKDTGRWDADGNTLVRAKDVEQSLAAFFAADNPRFDRERFLNACQGRLSAMQGDDDGVDVSISEPAFSLGDDGTLDTVIVCNRCGQELRFNFDGDGGYDAFVAWCFETAADEHDCRDE